jgi:heptosyltransferase-2
MQKIVLFETGWVGDTIVTIPAMRSIREKFPDDPIIRICSPVAEPILKNCPYIDHLLIYDRDGIHRGTKGKLKLLNKIREIGPNIFINLHVPDVNRGFRIYFRDNLFSFLTSARIRVGYYCSLSGFFLTHGIKTSHNHLSKFIVDLINDLTVRLGCKPQHELELWINDTERKEMHEFLSHHNVRNTARIIAINPGAKRQAKRWPLQRFIEVAQWLAKDATIVLTGSKDEINLANQMAAAVPYIITASGVLSLMPTAALLERCKLLITNDTGIMHIASALKVPTVAFFGPGNVRRWVPPHANWLKVIHHPISCSPCDKWECEDLSCMHAITVDEVKEAVLELFGCNPNLI